MERELLKLYLWDIKLNDFYIFLSGNSLLRNYQAVSERVCFWGISNGPHIRNVLEEYNTKFTSIQDK